MNTREASVKIGKVTAMLLMAGMLISLLGCAGGGKLQMVEEGYAPDQVTLGDVRVFIQESTISISDLRALTEQRIITEMRQAGVPFMTATELERTDMDPANVVAIDANVNFQRDAREMTQNFVARINYTIKRTSDSLVWLDGSAKSTDMAVSQSASMDLESAIEYAARALADDVSNAL